MSHADARARDHDRVKIIILLQGRESVKIAAVPFEKRHGAVMAQFLRRILEANCKDRPPEK